MAILRQRKKILTFIAISVLTLNIFFNFLQPLENTLLSIVSVPLRINNYLTREMRLILSYRILVLENNFLRDDIARLQSEVVQFDETFEENKRLKKLLDFKKESSFSLVNSRVFSRDNYFGNRVIVINKGRNYNLKENQAVITNLGLAGKVVEVGSNSSKVMLINDPNLSVAVIIQRNRQQGLLQGSFYGRCKIRYLDSEAEVEKGDVVVTSGLGGMFPKGIMVGRVVYADKEIGEDLQYAILKPEVDLNQIEEVFVIAR